MEGTNFAVLSHEAALDWVTLSAPMEPVLLDRFHGFMSELGRHFERQESPKKEVFEKGYRGVKYGAWQLKHRAYDGHCKIAVEGRDSEAAIELLEAEKIGYRITRCDGQITARHERSNLNYADELREVVQRARAEKARRGKQTMATFSGSVGDTGITIGSRTSAVYCRIYDYEAKHCHETSHAVWRYEVEAKEEAAQKVLQGWLKAENKREYVAGVVITRLAKYGIPLEGIGAMENLPISGTKEPGSIADRLRWLEKTVIPFLLNLENDGAAEALREAFRRANLTNAENVFLCGSLYQQDFEKNPGGS